MKTPICEVCLKSDILCGACQEKFNNGSITKTDINVSKFLFNLSGKVKSLSEAEVEKIIESKNLLIIAGSGHGAKLVGKGGSVVKTLAKQFGKNVRIIEHESDFREFVNNLLFPIKVNGINTVFSEGKELFKVRINKNDKERLPLPETEVADIIKNVFDFNVKVTFEN